jgi:O-antigen/teichoic acid export membrane protein
MNAEQTPGNPTGDSLKKRYAYKIGTNLFGSLIGGVTQMIIPRSLGAAGYGNFNFLTNFFGQTFEFLDSGCSAGFYSKLAQRPRETGLIRFNWGILLMISLLISLGVLASSALHLGPQIWPGQDFHFVVMAALWVFFSRTSTALGQMIDAHGLTVQGEIARMRQNAGGFLVILGLFLMDRLHLTQFFVAEYALFFLLGILFWKILKNASINAFPQEPLGPQRIKSYSKEFYNYAAPIAALSFASLFVNLGDRWLLQKFGGAREQGFYSLSYQVGAICFLLTGAMAPLLTQEFSKAFGSQDKETLKKLFVRTIPTLYALAAFFGVFSAIQAGKVGPVMGGEQFRGAAEAIGIMSLYPLHQTYGQLSGSLFYATGQTKLYRNISLATSLIALPVTFFLIGPKNLWGLALGSTGLAVKMVLIQFVTINIQLWYNTRYLGLSFVKLLGHQLYCAGALAVFAWISKGAADLWIKNPFFSLVTSGLLYSSLVLLATITRPSLFYLSPGDIDFLRQKIRSALSGQR